MSQIKKLAGQTFIYGLSSIVARIVNFFMVPLYSAVLPTHSYGRASEILAYIALLQVVLLFGFETGFFRYANKHKEQAEKVFSTAFIFVSFLSVIFLALTITGSVKLAEISGYAPYILIYTAIILGSDSITSILFTRLRFQNRPWRFAMLRSIKIGSEILFNLILFFLLPLYFKAHPESWLLNFMPAHASYEYIILAIFLSCIVALALFIPEIIKIHLKWDKELFVKLFRYSFPLMIAGLPGVANDFISRILFRFYAPETMSWEAQLGIFNANIKLAVFLVLFVQMFRYAAEPFFFASADKSDMKQTYADVMKYFVAFCMFIFLGISLYADVIVLILGRDYRIGVGVLPIMLFANVLLGMNFNLTMWYKLSDKTKYAVYVTLSGLVITFLISVFFMPVYGYYAAAWAYLISYLLMMSINIFLGNKYYPIDYDWKTILIYIISGILLYVIFRLIKTHLTWVNLLEGLVFLAVYLFLFMKTERLSIKRVLILVPQTIKRLKPRR